MKEFMIQGVDYFSQRDNKFHPSISCFPTSLAMVMSYCLKKEGKDKTAVGCSPEMQLEDYINLLIDEDETTEWMKKNQGFLGSWIWKYNRRTIYAIEEYIFNRLMLPHGYKIKAEYSYPYQTICNILEQTQLPMVIGGNFSSVSSVGGHMNTLIGYNSIGLKEFIVHDPYGNALDKYETLSKGEGIRYPVKFYQKDGDKIYSLITNKL
jgi:hypothetical protein